MSNSNIKAGEAWWEITARDQATAVLDKVAEKLKTFGKGTMAAGGAMAAAGIGVIGPVLAAAKSFSDYADGLNDTRVQTGLSVESLSELSFVAEQQGASLDGLKTGLQAMAKFTTAIASGNKGAGKVLDALGISTKEFMALSPEQRFRSLADQISKIGDPTLRAGVAMKVFGRGAGELMPMLALGSEGIAEMQQKAKDLGLSLSTEDAAKFGAFGDDMAAIGEQVKRVWWGLGSALIVAVEPFIPIVQAAAAAVIDFVNSNRPLIGIGLIAAGVLLGLGSTVMVVGAMIWAAGLVVSGAATLMSVAWTVAAGIKAGLIAVNTLLATTLFGEGIASTAASVGTWLLNVALAALSGVGAVATAVMAALTSPLGLVVLALAAVVLIAGAAVYAFFTLTDAGAKCAASISAGFVEMWGVVKQVFGGMWDAISAGDWGLAAEIGFAGVGIAWSAMCAGMSDAWYGFVNFMGSALLTSLSFVDQAIRMVLNGLIDAYNFAAEKMGWATVSAMADASTMLADMQRELDAYTGGKSAAAWKDVAAQRKELDTLTKKAADAKKAREDKMKIAVPDIPDWESPDTSKLAGGGKGQKTEGASLGTFNAAIAGMLNDTVPDHLSKIAENTTETNDKLDEIKDALAEGGMQWQ